MRRLLFIVFALLLCPKDGLCLSIDCKTEVNMMRCCELYEKSLHDKLPQFGEDLARQCYNEINGARDQVGEQKSFGACIPTDVTDEHLSTLFRAYVKNHPEFWDRPARFGMLNVWSLSWPCEKNSQQATQSPDRQSAPEPPAFFGRAWQRTLTAQAELLEQQQMKFLMPCLLGRPAISPYEISRDERENKAACTVNIRVRAI